MKSILTLILALISFSLFSQTNVRAWYADGQIWVVWEVELPLPETYAVHVSPTTFTSTDDATGIGRLFSEEYGAAALKEQVDNLATYRIPDGMGGTYQLAQNEGLFVATPHQSGSFYVAVTTDSETAVAPGVNITDLPVNYEIDPDNDPVECHLQATFPSPFTPGYTCHAFMMWADGRQNHWDARPDFPVMANAAKNGMPSLFMLSYSDSLDQSQPMPLTVWLHGGGGTARQSLPGGRSIVNINPEKGLLLSHNDDVIGWRDTVPPTIESPAWHFGWRKNWNPFVSDNFPMAEDTVINYTQKRYIWIDEWLAKNYNIDTNRININGHSMGGAGTTAITKCYPRHYASATVFNNGFHGPVKPRTAILFGPIADNFPTNLINENGDAVGFSQLWNLIDNCSPERDWPLIRCYHSKNDFNDAMAWDDYVVDNYRIADSLGMGVQLFWSERAHGMGSGPDWNDHWHNGDSVHQQTHYDDAIFEENNFSSDTWVPAFANHRLQADAGNPGDGTPGIGAGSSGDDWGTWGGYHRWEELEAYSGFYSWIFKGIFWLEDSISFVNDNCPVEYLDSDLFIRYNRPNVSSFCDYSQSEAAWVYGFSSLNDNYIEHGSVECFGDDLIKISDARIFRKDIRKLEFELFLIVATTSVGPSPFTATLHPNPVLDAANLTIDLQMPSSLIINISNMNGQTRSQAFDGQVGKNLVSLNVDHMPSGIYFVQIINEQGGRAVLKMVKQ